MHEPNRMLMRENKGFFSFAFDWYRFDLFNKPWALSIRPKNSGVNLRWTIFIIIWSNTSVLNYTYVVTRFAISLPSADFLNRVYFEYKITLIVWGTNSGRFPVRVPGHFEIFWVTNGLHLSQKKPAARDLQISRVLPTSRAVYQPITHRNLWSIA